jgi:hypothetical protein
MYYTMYHVRHIGDLRWLVSPVQGLDSTSACGRWDNAENVIDRLTGSSNAKTNEDRVSDWGSGKKVGFLCVWVRWCRIWQLGPQ